MTSGFISYSHKDREIADYIADELRARGVDVFIDYKKLKSGDYVEQLGVQIEQQEFFLVVVSPDAIESKWVRAELLLAFDLKSNCKIIPIWYRPVRLTKLMVLTPLERVDFTRWDDDQNMDEALRKLCRLMDVPFEISESPPVDRLGLRKSNVQEVQEAEGYNVQDDWAPAFAKGDIARLIRTAATSQKSDPEKAIFVYRQVLEIDPEYMDGRIKEFVARQEERMKPSRLSLLQEQTNYAMKQGKWSDATQLANSILELDENNEFAHKQLAIVSRNAECEPTYRLAAIANEAGDISAVQVFMTDIEKTCPEFGDPAGILRNQHITPELVGYLRNSHLLAGHIGAITRVAFSHSSNLLATASNDHSIKIWCTSTGELLHELTQHSARVNSVAFSSDDNYLASVSADRKVILWQVNSWEPLQLASVPMEAQDVIFAEDISQLIVGCRDGILRLFRIPELDKYTQTEVGLGSITSLNLSNDGRLFASSVRRPQHSYSSTISVWNTSNMQKISVNSWSGISGKGYIKRAIISSDLQYFAAVSDTIDVWTMPQARSYFHSRLDHMPVPDLGTGSSRKAAGINVRGQDLTFMSRNSSLLILVGVYNHKGRMVFVDLTESKVIGELTAHDETVTSVAVSADGRYIATGSDHCIVKIWQL